MRTSLQVTAVGLCWAVAVIGAGLAVADGQTQARDNLVARFADRADTSAAFVTAYVDDVFASERRIAASLPRGGGTASEFARDVRMGGFTAAVLLDRRGLVVAANLPGTSCFKRWHADCRASSAEATRSPAWEGTSSS